MITEQKTEAANDDEATLAYREARARANDAWQAVRDANYKAWDAAWDAGYAAGLAAKR